MDLEPPHPGQPTRLSIWRYRERWKDPINFFVAIKEWEFTKIFNVRVVCSRKRNITFWGFLNKWAFTENTLSVWSFTTFSGQKAPLHLCDSNAIRTHNYLDRKRTLNHLAKLAKWFSVCLRTKWLWVWIALLPLKFQIWSLLQTRYSLTFRQTIECEFALKLVCDTW